MKVWPYSSEQGLQLMDKEFFSFFSLDMSPNLTQLTWLLQNGHEWPVRVGDVWLPNRVHCH